MSELDPIAIGERRECVLRFRGGAEIDLRPDPIAQLEMAGDEIGVKVREDDVTNPQGVVLGKRDIFVDVALRVDHHRLAGLFVSNQIRRVREATEIKLVQDHRFIMR